MTNCTPFRMAVIGSGSIADVAHFPAITSNPQTVLVAVCDIKPEIAEGAAQKWGVPNWYTDYREMLEKEKLDAVIIASPNYLHYEHGKACAEAGVHAIIEKPLAVTNKEAWALVNVFNNANRKLMVGCDRRFWEQTEICKQLVDSDFIGKIMMAKGTMHEDWHLYQEKVAVGDFRLRRSEAGGGTLWDQGSHKIDQVLWLMGGDVRRVIGIVDRRVSIETPHEPDDIAWVLMEFDDGRTACISTNKYSPVATETTELYGTDGTIMLSSDAINPYQSAPLSVFTNKDLSWDELPEILKLYRYPELFWPEDLPVMADKIRKRWMTVYPPREWSYQRMLRHFLDCLINDKKPIVTGEEGAKVMEVICGVVKSMRVGRWVELPLEEEVVPPGYVSALVR